MTVVLWAIGLLATAAGFIAVGFGIPNQAFGLGNTLIVAGTIAVASGLILIGVSLVLGQLRNIAEALQTQPRAVRLTESAEPQTPGVVMAAASRASTAASPDTAEPPPLPQLEPLPATEQRPAEPFQPALSEPPAPLDWLRSKSKPVSSTPAAEPPMVEVQDEAPLSPRTPPRPVVPPVAEPGNEPKVWSPSRDNTAPVQSDAAPRVEQPMPRATPQVEPAKEKDRFGFDLVWSDRSGAAPSSELPKREPALDMPMPPIPARPRESRATEKRPDPAPRKPAVERGPAILKSGVIDGMPYTLYADGSIEAQLPQGTVKFASVDALRAHLEKQS